MNPLLYMGIMMFVFSHLMRFKVENYGAFILSGILAWNLFPTALRAMAVPPHAQQTPAFQKNSPFTIRTIRSCVIVFLHAKPRGAGPNGVNGILGHIQREVTA